MAKRRNSRTRKNRRRRKQRGGNRFMAAVGNILSWPGKQVRKVMGEPEKTLLPGGYGPVIQPATGLRSAIHPATMPGGGRRKRKNRRKSNKRGGRRKRKNRTQKRRRRRNKSNKRGGRRRRS